MYYRAVEITDGESSEPVSIVGVHPITWSRIADGPPSIGFVEADDTIDALVEACEVISNLANPGKTMTDEEWLAVIGPIMEQQERPDETDAVFEAIYRIANAALAAARQEEAEMTEPKTWEDINQAFDIREGQLMWVDLRPVTYPDNQRHTCQARFKRNGRLGRASKTYLLTPTRYRQVLEAGGEIEPFDDDNDFGFRIYCKAYLQLFERQRNEEWAMLADAASY